MLQINLNPQFAEILKHHGISVDVDDEFINTDLPGNVKFKVRTVYEEVNGYISSRLDVMVLTGQGEQILECCGDNGTTIEKAVTSNFQNFSGSTLHPLLAALGCVDPHIYDQVTIEEWEINGKTWKVYIGNLTPKILTDKPNSFLPPSEFFDSFERGIKTQKLVNRIHWFRGYYSQLDNEITTREFLMDNDPVADTDTIFKDLPVLPNVRFYSCRNFIILINKACS